MLVMLQSMIEEHLSLSHSIYVIYCLSAGHRASTTRDSAESNTTPQGLGIGYLGSILSVS